MPLDMKGLRRMSRQFVDAISKVPVAKREVWMSDMLTAAIDIRYGKVQELDKKDKIEQTLEGLARLAKPVAPVEKPKEVNSAPTEKPKEEKPE